MSALTKTKAKRNTKKPANRPAKKLGRRLARRKSNVPKGKSGDKRRKAPVALVKAGTQSRSRKPTKAKATPRASRGSALITRRKAKVPANQGLGARKTDSRISKKLPAAKSLRSGAGLRQRRPVLSSKPREPRKTTIRSRIAGRPTKISLSKDKLRQKKEQERLKTQQAREREKLSKSRKQEKLRKQRELENARKLRKQEQARKQREHEALRTARAKETQRRAKEEEKRKINQEREANRQAELRAREEERRRGQQIREEAKRAKEQEKQRQKAEREAEREQARRQKEEERAKREAEREAYRKAKEAERERLRAAREAQKRALEGRIAEATRNANKLGGGRSSTTRIYSPKAIPDQSGTTRRVSDASASMASTVSGGSLHFADTQGTDQDVGTSVAGITSVGDETPRTPTPPERPLPTAESVEERYRIIEERLKDAPTDFRHEYQEALDMSWIYHDSALEGVVYTFQELRAAIDHGTAAIADSSLQPVVEEVRRHKAAIELVRELGEKKRAPITVDVIRKIYLTLHPEEGDLKTVKYRRDIPQHRLYFHEYAHPEKIQHKVRQVVDWLNGPEPKKLKSPIRVASRAHYELLRVFPFQTDSGKVARLFMNLLLLRAGHPPAIVHSTERQRYYEALRGALPTLIQMVTESILNGLVSIEKLLDDQGVKQRPAST